jgi:type IV pilus assembly protein PilM
MLRNNKNNSGIDRVGLDIGSHSVKGVEIVERGPELVIRSAGTAPIAGVRARTELPDTGATVSAIRNLWATAGFSSRRVVLALPPEAVYLKWLHLEASDSDELDRVARAAAVRGAPFPAHSAIVDFRVLPSRGAPYRNIHYVMLVAASGDAVDNLLTIAESADLEPVAVDIGAAAALRSFEMQKRFASPLWSGQPLAHCIIGASNTTITVLRNGALEFARTVPVGGSDITNCIVEATGLSWVEAERIKTTPGARLVSGATLVASHENEELRVACEGAVGRLAREVQRSLRFFRSQFAEGSYLGMIGATTLSGGAALLKGMDICLQEMGTDVAGVINPFAGFSVDAGSSGIQYAADKTAAFTTALGLAIGDYWSNWPSALVSEEVEAAG